MCVNERKRKPGGMGRTRQLRYPGRCAVRLELGMTTGVEDIVYYLLDINTLFKDDANTPKQSMMHRHTKQDLSNLIYRPMFIAWVRARRLL